MKQTIIGCPNRSRKKGRRRKKNQHQERKKEDSTPGEYAYYRLSRSAGGGVALRWNNWITEPVTKERRETKRKARKAIQETNGNRQDEKAKRTEGKREREHWERRKGEEQRRKKKRKRKTVVRTVYDSTRNVSNPWYIIYYHMYILEVWELGLSVTDALMWSNSKLRKILSWRLHVHGLTSYGQLNSFGTKRPKIMNPQAWRFFLPTRYFVRTYTPGIHFGQHVTYQALK